MRQYNVIILAAGSGGPLESATGIPYKAMIPIHGRPMIDWVVRAFAGSQYVNHIVVVGPSELDDLACMKDVRKRLDPRENLIQNLVKAIGYVKYRLYHGALKHPGYLISYGDAVFLTTPIVDETLEAFSAADGNISLVYVEKGTYERAGIRAKRTYIPIGGEFYTGGTMCYLSRLQLILPHLIRIAELRKVRKDPEGILKNLGCLGKTLPEIETALSEELSTKLRIHVSPFPEIGMDVDKPSDLETALEMLDP